MIIHIPYQITPRLRLSMPYLLHSIPPPERYYLPPIPMLLSRIFAPASHRRPQTFTFRASRNTTPSPNRCRPAILALIISLTSSASSAVCSQCSAVARVHCTCFEYVSACMCLMGLRCRNRRAESLQPIGCTGSARHPGPGTPTHSWIQEGVFAPR